MYFPQSDSEVPHTCICFLVESQMFAWTDLPRRSVTSCKMNFYYGRSDSNYSGRSDREHHALNQSIFLDCIDNWTSQWQSRQHRSQCHRLRATSMVSKYVQTSLRRCQHNWDYLLMWTEPRLPFTGTPAATRLAIQRLCQTIGPWDLSSFVSYFSTFVPISTYSITLSCDTLLLSSSSAFHW